MFTRFHNHPLWLAHGADPLRASIGAFIGLGVTMGLGAWFVLRYGAPTALVAPIGASAVLVFAVPASPLAQPRAVIGGNLVSAVVGLMVAHMGLAPWVMAALAVGAAILAMQVLRCIHPPGGAMALVAALGVHGKVLPWSFLASPVAVNTLVLVAVGWLFNNLTGSHYPHHQEALPELRMDVAIDYDRADLEVVLGELDDLPDIAVEDLDAIVRAVMIRAKARARPLAPDPMLGHEPG